MAGTNITRVSYERGWVPKGEKPDTYPKGRRCKAECITVLSIYNAGPFCWLHAQKHAAQVARQAELDAARVERGRKRRERTRAAVAAIA